MMKGSHCVALVWPNLKNTGMDTDAITNPMALQNARVNTPAWTISASRRTTLATTSGSSEAPPIQDSRHAATETNSDAISVPASTNR